MLTVRLNTAVAVRVAATETVAVVVAVANISGLGNGTVRSVPGTSKYCTSDLGGGCGIGGSTGLGAGFSSFLSDSVVPSIPGGARRSLGGTTSGLYEGKRARGTSSTGLGKTGGSGSRRTGSTGGVPKSISCYQKDHVR